MSGIKPASRRGLEFVLGSEKAWLDPMRSHLLKQKCEEVNRGLFLENFMKKELALCLLVLTITPLEASAKDFGRLKDARVITCSEAVKYRDNVLVREYDAIVARYADGTADRQKRMLEKLEIELKKLDAQWIKTEEAQRKKIAAQWVALSLSVIGTGTGEWAAAGASVENRAAVKILTDRATTASTTITTSVMSGSVSNADIALLPVSAIVAVAFPPAALGVTVLSLGLGAIDQYENIADLNLESVQKH